MEQIRVHLIVTGRVQGVAYRASTLRVAKQLGLSGWVKNCFNGNVEIMAEGSTDPIAKFIDWVKQGPKYAVVDNVSVEQSPARGEFTHFLIIN